MRTTMLLPNCPLCSPLSSWGWCTRRCRSSSTTFRRWVTSMPTDCVLVKLHFTNAFNTLRRDSHLEAVERDIPELCSFAHASYSCRPMWRHGSSVIRSEESTQQGDPMGPLEFCIALQPILSELKSELRVAFLDDLTLGGKVDVVAHDVQHIAQKEANWHFINV